MDDLERVGREALDAGEVVGKPLRDRYVEIEGARDGAIGDPERPALPERVEPVLRARDVGHPGEARGSGPVEVGVDEVRVNESRPLRPHRGEDGSERTDVRCPREHHPVDGDTPLAQGSGELLGAGLVLVEVEEANVEATLPQRREQQQQVVLRTGDPGDLGDVEDRLAHRSSARATSSRRSAQPSTPWSRSARRRNS